MCMKIMGETIHRGGHNRGRYVGHGGCGRCEECWMPNQGHKDAWSITGIDGRTKEAHASYNFWENIPCLECERILQDCTEY